MCACFQGGDGATTAIWTRFSPTRRCVAEGSALWFFFWAVAGEARDDVGVGADLALSFIAWCGLLRVVPGS